MLLPKDWIAWNSHGLDPRPFAVGYIVEQNNDEYIVKWTIKEDITQQTMYFSRSYMHYLLEQRDVQLMSRVWKVVSYNGIYNSLANTFLNANEFSVTYDIGKVTVGWGNTPLLAFDNLDDAVYWRERMVSSVQVLPALTVDPQPIKHVATWGTLRKYGVEQWWQKKPGPYFDTPSGTVACPYIILEAWT